MYASARVRENGGTAGRKKGSVLFLLAYFGGKRVCFSQPSASPGRTTNSLSEVPYAINSLKGRGGVAESGDLARDFHCCEKTVGSGKQPQCYRCVPVASDQPCHRQGKGEQSHGQGKRCMRPPQRLGGWGWELSGAVILYHVWCLRMTLKCFSHGALSALRQVQQRLLIKQKPAGTAAEVESRSGVLAPPIILLFPPNIHENQASPLSTPITSLDGSTSMPSFCCEEASRPCRLKWLLSF